MTFRRGQLRRRNALRNLCGERLILLLALLLLVAFSVPSPDGSMQVVAEESQETSFYDCTDSDAAAHYVSRRLPSREAPSTALNFFEQVRPPLSDIRSEIAPRAPPHA